MFQPKKNRNLNHHKTPLLAASPPINHKSPPLLEVAAAENHGSNRLSPMAAHANASAKVESKNNTERNN